MEKISNLLIKLSHHLFTDASQQEKFINALIHPQPFNPCILWTKPKPIPHPFDIECPTTWQPEFVDRLSLNEKPGKHPLHQTGHFYCLDFSSFFAASILLTLPQPLPFIVDMCAAPGGKSIFAWKTLNPDLILCNETIGKRLGMLKSNLNRCQIQPSVVKNLESQVLAELLPESASLVLVDAPCSGQSLLAKGEKNPGCFHPVTIKNNSGRQKRILANSAKIVAPQGYLAYMTCTYSIAENEGVVEWFLNKFPHFQAVEIPHLFPYQSHLTTLPCYRMWPQEHLGAGAFTILLKNLLETSHPQSLPEWLEQARFN